MDASGVSADSRTETAAPPARSSEDAAAGTAAAVAAADHQQAGATSDCADPPPPPPPPPPPSEPITHPTQPFQQDRTSIAPFFGFLDTGAIAKAPRIGPWGAALTLGLIGLEWALKRLNQFKQDIDYEEILQRERDRARMKEEQQVDIFKQAQQEFEEQQRELKKYPWLGVGPFDKAKPTKGRTKREPRTVAKGARISPAVVGIVAPAVTAPAARAPTAGGETKFQRRLREIKEDEIFKIRALGNPPLPGSPKPMTVGGLRRAIIKAVAQRFGVPISGNWEDIALWAVEKALARGQRKRLRIGDTFAPELVPERRPRIPGTPRREIGVAPAPVVEPPPRVQPPFDPYNPPWPVWGQVPGVGNITSFSRARGLEEQPEMQPQPSRRDKCECTTTGLKRRKGECAQGYFREMPGKKTQFTVWSRRKCVPQKSTSRRI